MVGDLALSIAHMQEADLSYVYARSVALVNFSARYCSSEQRADVALRCYFYFWSFFKCKALCWYLLSALGHHPQRQRQSPPEEKHSRRIRNIWLGNSPKPTLPCGAPDRGRRGRNSYYLISESPRHLHMAPYRGPLTMDRVRMWVH